MEGDLMHYGGLMGRNKKVYGLIDGGDFVAFKGQKYTQEFQEILRIPLKSPYSTDKGVEEYTFVYPYGNNQFILATGPQS